ncbi:DUF4212 domain-containing protein [soil metagenome]
MRHARVQASQDKLAGYWRSARKLTLALLLIWLLLTLVIVFFARELSGLNFFGWPFSFYMAAQGATLIYVAIVAYYAWAMRRLDQLLNSSEEAGVGAAAANAGQGGKDMP